MSQMAASLSLSKVAVITSGLRPGAVCVTFSPLLVDHIDPFPHYCFLNRIKLFGLFQKKKKESLIYHAKYIRIHLSPILMWSSLIAANTGLHASCAHQIQSSFQMRKLKFREMK